MRAILFGAVLALLATGAAHAADKPFHPTRNSYGQPDFGDHVWSFNSLTRLERPDRVKTLVLSEEDAKRIRPGAVLPSDGVGTAETEAHDEFNYDWARLGNEIRSSWLTEPANGKLPYSPAGRALYTRRGPGASTDNPEGRSTYERCMTMPQNGPPMLNAAYNNNMRFMQTRDFVILQIEANHDARIVYLVKKEDAAKSHLPAAVTQWSGNSVGWFEGDTLVVQTQGFAPQQSDRRSAMTPVYMSKDAKVTERFTRISKTQIRYDFEVDDPSVFSTKWKGEIPLTITDGLMYEYACHEGNYGLENILSGARYEDAERAKKAAAQR